MREQIESRLAELSAELEAGQQLHAELEAKRVDLERRILRISGAAQVLREVLDATADGGPRTVMPGPRVAAG